MCTLNTYGQKNESVCMYSFVSWKCVYMCEFAFGYSQKTCNIIQLTANNSSCKHYTRTSRYIIGTHEIRNEHNKSHTITFCITQEQVKKQEVNITDIYITTCSVDVNAFRENSYGYFYWTLVSLLLESPN